MLQPNPRGVALGTALVLAALAGACPPLLAAPKFQIVFPDEPYAVPATNAAPGWVKFIILMSDLDTVYYQNSNQYPFHYDFAVAELPPFSGMSPSEFDQVTLHEQGQQAILGAVILPPLVGGADVYPEYGIQFVRQDPYPPTLVRDLFFLVRSTVLAGPEVQAFYFPSFEQQASAEEHAAYYAAEGIPISSPARWVEGNACYSFGWALGTLVYVPPEEIDAAYLAGSLGPEDVLLTDGVPAEIPAVAGVISLAPATPSSHVVILAQTFHLPFVHLALPADAQRAQGLVGRLVALRADDVQGACRVRLVDAEGQLDAATIQTILALAQPPPLDISPMEPYPAYSANAGTLQLADIRHFGGKASSFGTIRRAIPGNSPVATAFSFNLWNGFLDQPLGTGRTLREEIALALAPFTWPPDMATLAATLEEIQDLIKDTSSTTFAPALQTAVLATLQDPQYGFDPFQNLRFRSSTNVEDAEQFTGAGLYDSFSGCLADDLDGNSAGPSHCDASESSERGVFRAIRRVLASFYNLNAHLERLRYGVDESQVGMALLVHHSFPDAIELANGVGLLDQTGSFRSAYLVSQTGAHPVTNPEPGTIPEEVDVYISSSGGWVYPTVIEHSNLLPLGATVLEYPDEYEELTNLLVEVAERYTVESGLSTFVLDFEYKKLAPGGVLSVDQVRRVPQASDTPSVTPFLLNQPVTYCLFQGETANVFANHRLKSRWSLTTENVWLTPESLAASFFAETAMQYGEACQLYEQTGPLPDWPAATHGFAGGTATDGFALPQLQNPREYLLTTPAIPGLVAPSESPLLVLADFGWPLHDPAQGCLELQVEYASPVPSLDWTGPITTTVDDGRICPCFTPMTGDVLRQRVLFGDDGVAIVTTYYWPPPVDVAAGYTAPLSRFVDTLIYGLTSTPITLTSEWSQTYRPEHHNFSEHFLFEPALDPGVTPQQLQELEAAGIRAIHAFDGFPGAQLVYYSDAQWKGACLGCTGFDGDHDGRCTGAPTFDCDDADPTAWATPGEVLGLVLGGGTVLAWSAPDEPGATAVVYDVLRSESPLDFVAPAICVESDGADVSAADVGVPPAGAVFHYLVRAENGCPAGAGSLGHGSDGGERAGRACP
jgi:hypothetical protein